MKRYFLFRRAICVTSVLFVAAACGKLTFDDPTIGADEPRLGSSEVTELRADLKELPDPNRFEVNLAWSAEPDISAYVVKRKDPKGQLTQLDMLAGNATTFSDASVGPSSEYVYTVTGMRNGTVLGSREATIHTPLDLEVVGAVDWPASEITGINRLFLRKDSRLRTLGRDFRIDVRAVIADDAIIESFAEGRAAGMGAVGAGGGSLDFRAQTGMGALLVLARGENGGIGFPGGRGGPGAPGGKGSAGEADYYMDCTMSVLAAFMPGGDRGHCYKDWYCKRETGNGGGGGQGHRGGPGSPGANGGDSMSVSVEIADSKNLSLRYEVLPGLGGRGGDGGPGGSGGAGGPPGDRDSGGHCRVASPGPTGPVGGLGATGAGGQNGERRPVCLSLGGTKIGDC